MSPRELDVETVYAKLRLIEDFLKNLEELSIADTDRLNQKPLERLAVERILTQLVDLSVSVNSHVAVATLQKSPSNYRESFDQAAEAGAISAVLASELAPSVGLRNVLTYEYVQVDLDIVAESIPLALNFYGRYVNEVAQFLSDAWRD